MGSSAFCGADASAHKVISSPSERPDWVISDDLKAWYFVAASKELPPGGVLPARVGSREIVLFRSHSGSVRALDPHCAHMGARLQGGKVDGEHLVCPLHGWRYQGDGKVAGGRNCVRSWPVVERFGAVFVFHGQEPTFLLPEGLTHFHWSAMKGAIVDAPWYALTANAFDTHHYEAVHLRRLLEPPLIEQPDAYRFDCSYLSMPTGTALSDRLMTRLAPRGIRVTMQCYGGPLFVVQSRLGRRETALVVGMEPLGHQTRLRLSVGSPKPGPISWVAGFLYSSFLKRDLGAMSGIRLQPYTGLAVDETMERFARYLESLPVAS